MADDVQQQLVAFQEKTENAFEKAAEDNEGRIEKLRGEMNAGIQSIRDDMQYRLDKIERLLLDTVPRASNAKAATVTET